MAVSFIRPPPWLDTLLEQTFFTDCTNQKGCKVKNVLCLECCNIYCTRCVDQNNHHHSRHLQLLRYTHQYIIKSSEIRKLMDCAKIQPHMVNGVKAYFLKARENTNSYRGSHNICPICQCFVQPTKYVYCSIMCKVYHFLESPTGLQGLLRKHKNPPNDQDEGQASDFNSWEGGESSEAGKQQSSTARAGTSAGSQLTMPNRDGGEHPQQLGANRRKSPFPARAPFS